MLSYRCRNPGRYNWTKNDNVIALCAIRSWMAPYCFRQEYPYANRWKIYYRFLWWRVRLQIKMT